MNVVLMIAFHYPPLGGGSGQHRTAGFVRLLPSFGWRPVVLTVAPSAYPAISASPPPDRVNEGVPVARPVALDAARHLSVAGRYPRWLALPDRWWSWFVTAVPTGLQLVREHRPDVLWSTFPIPTAHLLGLALQKLTGVPWVADFRDFMTRDGYPRDAATRTTWRWIERHTVRACRRAVFTAPGTARMYRERYPELPAQRWSLVPNGYDEEAFRRAERLEIEPVGREGRRTLIHSGTLYPGARDPRALFRAVARLVRDGHVDEGRLRIVLRASDHDREYRDQIDVLGIQGIVRLEEPVRHDEALAEMMAADGLLLLQGAACNPQIPAKLYEYLRAGRPILALTDPAGDTAAELRDVGFGTIARIDSEEDIASKLREFLERRPEDAGASPATAAVLERTREHSTARLARLLDEVVAERPRRASVGAGTGLC